MGTSFTDIQNALASKLNTLPGLPDVAWSNVKYDPIEGTEYIEETVLPSDTEQAGMGLSGVNEDLGTYQINIRTPKNQGRARSNELADSIADHFSRGTTLTSGSVSLRLNAPSIGVGTAEDVFYMVPVRIRYQTFTQPR